MKSNIKKTILIIAAMYSANLYGLEWINSFQRPDWTRTFSIVDNKAFVINNNPTSMLSQIELFDISNPYDIRLISILDSLHGAIELVVKDSLVFVADYYSNLYILNYSDIYNPAIIGSCDQHVNLTDIDIQGDYVYLAAGRYGIEIVDISNPKQPTSVAGKQTYNDDGCIADKIEIQDSLLYIVGDDLFIYSISKSYVPAFIGSCNTEDAIEVTINEEYALVSERLDGLTFVDISNPSDPTLITNVDLTGYTIKAIPEDSNTVYILKGHSGFDVINYSNLDSIEIIASYDTPDRADDLDIYGQFIYEADFSGGIHVFDKLKPSLSSYDTLIDGYTRLLTISDTTLLAFGVGARAYNLKDPLYPTLTAILDSNKIATHYNEADSLAFICYKGSGKLNILNKHRLYDAPILDYNRYNSPVCSQIHQGYLIVADRMIGLSVLDISTPSLPVEIGSINGFEVKHFVASDTIVYIASDYHGLTIVNIANPESLTLIDTLSIPGNTEKVIIDSCYAYIAAGYSGIKVFNISDPRNISLISSYDTPGYAVDILVDENKLYIADQFKRILVLDISNPGSIKELGTLYSDQNATNLIIKENVLYVAEDNNGFSTIDLSQTLSINPLSTPSISHQSLMSSRPMPFSTNTSFLMQPTKSVRSLIVLDIHGTRVMTLHVPAASTSISWDGKDMNGATIVPGIYIVRIMDDNGIESEIKIMKTE